MKNTIARMLSLNYSLLPDNSDGKTQFFTDTTIGYGGSNIDYSDVKQVRMLASNYPDQIAPITLSGGAVLDIYRQYQKTNLGSSVYDGKTISTGDYFIPFVSGLTVIAGDTFVTTGSYSIYTDPATYLPTVNHNVLNMSTAYWGFITDVFPSLVAGLQYEVYTDTSPLTLSNVVLDTQYIVYGTGVATAIYNGNTYRVGEIFKAGDNGSVAFTGGAVLKVINASINRYISFYFPLAYRFLTLLINKYDCKCENYILKSIELKMWALQWANFTQWISVKWATDTISWIDEQLTILEDAI